MASMIPKLSRLQKKRLLKSGLVVARLATSSRGGKPHVVPVWFLDESGRIYVPSPSRTLKVRNISQNQRASIIFDSFAGVLNAKGVLAEGQASILKGPRSKEINLRIHRKYVGANRLKKRSWQEFAAEDDVTIVIKPTKWRSWDFSKLEL